MPENEVKTTTENPNTTPPKRRFVFNGMVLTDPDPKMTPQKVAEFHSLLHAELTNATVNGCSLEGLMLKLKFQYFGYLMQRADSFEKTLMLGKIEGWRRG